MMRTTVHSTAGSYLVTFNEVPALTDTQIAIVQPHQRLILAGATHRAFRFRGRRSQIRTMLTVGSRGVHVKENARIAKLLILQS